MTKTSKRPGPVCAWYALRRTLPTWSFDDNLRELEEHLPRYGVDELIVKVDTEEFTHGQPPLRWVKRYQRNLFQIREVMERIGVVYSLNPWITMGHIDRGRDSRKDLPGLSTMVGHDGTQCTCCACPLCETWRGNTAQVWRLYAQTKPRVMWIEDDIRTFNHLPVRYGCFCSEHMRRFSELAGRGVGREELVAAMLKPGKPHPWRRMFLELQGRIMTETVAFLARAVHDVSPETSFGLMSSGPRNHCLDGRHWHRFALTLADGKPLYSRPPMGNYHEDSMRGFYYSQDSIKITRHCMPPGTIEQTEVENVPFTRYSKSVAFTFLEMAVSFAFGSHGVTMNLFDHAGTPMEREPEYGRMLAARKPFLDALARRAQLPGTLRGVRLLHHEDAAWHKRLAIGARYGAIVPEGLAIATMLEAHGIPTTYDESPVTAASGQQLRSCTDDELRALLSAGLLLDGMAALVLVERGFGAEIGVKTITPPTCIDKLGAFGAEEFLNPAFGGRDGKYLTLTLPDLPDRPNLCVMEPARGAQVISRLVDADAKRFHVCMMAYENRLGGRVVIHGLELASAYGIAFNHTFRAEQLLSAVHWLTRGQTPLTVRGGVYPLALRKDCRNQTLLGLFNLTLDPWPYAEFALWDKRSVQKVEILTPSGRWLPARDADISRDACGVIVRHGRPVSFDAPLFLTLHW